MYDQAETHRDPFDRSRDVVRLEALGLMTAGIVHDLGNMIQLLSSSFNVIERHPQFHATGALDPVIDGARSSLERASELIQAILGFTRKPVARRDNFDVALCLSRLEQLLKWTARGRFRLSVHVAADLPQLPCDRRQLENAVLNLVLNAYDAMPDGGTIEIQASTWRDRHLVKGVVLEVIDTGHGMTEDICARAFEPLFTTKGENGTGLGLAMVHRFAQDARGSVLLESSPGVGTRASLYLPAVPA